MKKYKLPIEAVIEKLGYNNSGNLVYFNDFDCAKYTNHITKVISVIKPFAIYFLDEKPFILFFDSQFDDASFKTISKAVWNAQIPIAMFCDEQTVKIYNGLSMNLSSYFLEKATEFPVENCTLESDFSYFEITNPMFWDRFLKRFSCDRLNQFLLRNIKYLTEELKNTYNIGFATKLVLRLIFIRFLIDRGVDLGYGNFSNNIEQSRSELLRCLKNKETVYNLFLYLKDKFNGNLFDLGDEFDSPELTQNVFDLLADFLSGTLSMKDGQLSLFTMYDFNIIPVELISNIYEILLGRKVRVDDNAFYTPNYLVEYILDKTTLGFLKKHSKYSILDPACGSGVFLVDSYRRMVEENLHGNMYCDEDNLLKELLTKNVFGIDINEEAIDVTIFSLYLTILDYKDPKSLKTFTLPNLKGTNLFVGDFFDDIQLKSLQGHTFDFIIGNPPWGNVKTGLHLQYCTNNGYKDKQQNNEICRSFIFRAKDFCHSNTICSFIVHSKLLYNQQKPAKRFRAFLLQKTKINYVVEMSSVRKLVFEKANAPAVILSFSYSEGNSIDNIINYISIKRNVFLKLFNIIVIEKNDVKYVTQELLYKYDWAWKTIVYGFSNDFNLITKLKKRFRTLSEEIKDQEPILVCGAGVEYHDGDKRDASHLVGKKLLNSNKSVNHFFVDSNNASLFKKSEIHRPRLSQKELFEPPYVLIPTGVNCKDYKLKAAFSEESFVSQKTMYIVKGSDEQIPLLLNLSGLLNSSLYAYLNLMLGTSIGIEREQRLMNDVLAFPYAFSESIVKEVEYINNEKKQENTLNSPKINLAIKKLDDLVLELFKLKNNKFIDYALNIQIPELTNRDNKSTYRKVSENDLLTYSKYFEKRFSAIYTRVGKHIDIKLYQNILNRFSIFELSIQEGIEDTKISFVENPNKNREFLTEFSLFSYNDRFHQIRDVIHFESDSFFIIKPNLYKYWHPAIAEIDLSDVMDQIMNDSGDDL